METIVKNFEDFISINESFNPETDMNYDGIKKWVSHYSKIKNLKVYNKGGETYVDVDGDVEISDNSIESLPFKFGTVDGNFSIYECRNLKSLEGCPKVVTDSFGCFYCDRLISLEGCPEMVDGDFECFGCGKDFTKEDVKKYCAVKGRIIAKY